MAPNHNCHWCGTVLAALAVPTRRDVSLLLALAVFILRIAMPDGGVYQRYNKALAKVFAKCGADGHALLGRANDLNGRLINIQDRIDLATLGNRDQITLVCSLLDFGIIDVITTYLKDEASYLHSRDRLPTVRINLYE